MSPKPTNVHARSHSGNASRLNTAQYNVAASWWSSTALQYQLCSTVLYVNQAALSVTLLLEREPVAAPEELRPGSVAPVHQKQRAHTHTHVT